MTAVEPSLVAVQLPPGPQWLRTVEQIWQRGDAVAPLPPGVPPSVLRETLAALRPAALIDATGTAPLPDAVPVAPGTGAVIVTSGSTGIPKGVVLPTSALQASVEASVRRLAVGADDRWLLCVPVHHVAGLRVVLSSRLAGAPAILHNGFDVERVAAEREATLVSLVPTMLRRLLDAGADLAHLRCVLLGGSAAGPQLLDDAAAAGVPVVTAYGMSETAGGCVYDGVPLDGVRVDIADGDRIRVAGPVLFSGYRLRDDLTAQAMDGEWLRTADVGRWDADGRLEILGRADDVINTGGEKVHAADIAGILEEHPLVAEAAVAGVPDAEWGERVVAYIVRRGSTAPTLAELRELVSTRRPAYMAPREVVLVNALPRLASGKLDRLRLTGPDIDPRW